jgi:hypothetical protein
VHYLDRLFGPYRNLFLVYLVLVAAYFGLALAISSRSYDEILDIESFIAIPGLAIIPVLAFAGWVAVLAVMRQHERPTRSIIRLLYRNRHWMIRSTIILVLISSIAGGAFMAVKVAIPRIVPYFADPYFAAIDRTLFFGRNPWEATHNLLGAAATRVVDVSYSLWFGSLTIVVLWTSFDRDRKFQMQASFAYLLCWFLLGNVLAIMLSSVGPIFYDQFYGGSAFAPLLDKLDAAPRAMFIRQYLLDNYGDEVLGSGISAAPSLHVAVTQLFFLMCLQRFGNRWPTWFAGFYVFVILFGSVHLGWHYLTDGLISLILTPLIWSACGWLVDRVSRRSTTERAVQSTVLT